MHQKPPQTPLCFANNASKSGQVVGLSSFEEYGFSDFKCLVSRLLGWYCWLEDWRLLVVSEDLPTDIHDLSQCCVGSDRFDDGVHGIGLLVLERLAQLVQCFLNLCIVPCVSDPDYPLDLSSLSLLVDLQGIDWLFLIDLILVHTNHDPLVPLKFLLVTVGCLCNLALQESSLDRVQQPSYTFDLVKILERFFLHLISKPFQVVRTAKRIDCVRDACLFRDDLLGSQCDGGCLF